MLEKPIIIVGAGPSGLLLALNLARAGIRVRVLEASTEPDRQPRATHYGPAAVRELRRAGLLAAMAARGSRVPRSVSWRSSGATDAALVAQLPRRKPPPRKEEGNAQQQEEEKDGVVSLSLNLMVECLVEAVQAEPLAVLEFGRRVVDVGQDASSAWVSYYHGEPSQERGQEREQQEQEQEQGEEQAKEPLLVRVQGSYVVGCDGSSSTVRTCLFGKEFPGSTWEPWLVAVNVAFPPDTDAAFRHDNKNDKEEEEEEDKEDKEAGLSDINFLMHPTDWCLMARIGAPTPLWRVTYGDDGTLARDDVVAPARIWQRLQTVLPRRLLSTTTTSSSSSSSQTPPLEVVTASPYRAHQRCAPRFRVGRLLLAADAAHLCNPFGGMGLTSGIVDVGGLSDCLIGIHRGVVTTVDDGEEEEEEDILAKYDTVRRGIYHDVIDKITTANLKRIMQDAHEAVQTDPLLIACREAENNAEVAAKVAAMMRAPALLQHDFTQYYSV